MKSHEGFTTVEKLQMEVSCSYGAVLKYGDKVFVTAPHCRGGFLARIYEFVDTPEESGLSEIECRLSLVDAAERTFEDGGHAIAWCLAQQ